MALLYQLDAAAITTLFSDTGKTTQVTDGGTVAAWTAPNGSITTDAVQSTSGSRPTYRANYSSSGYPALEFDGTNDHLSVAHSAAWNVSILEIFLVATFTSSTSYRGVFAKWSTISWNDGWGVAIFNGKFSFGAPSFTNAVAKYTDSSRILCSIRLENAGNGGAFGRCFGGSVTGTGPQNNSASVLIGCGDLTGAFYMSGAINEIRVYGGGETDQTIVDVTNTLRRKWGLASVAAGTPSHPMFQQVIG